MKRVFVYALLVLCMVIPLSAESLVISLLDTGLNALSAQSGIVVTLDGKQVSLGGSTLGTLKKTLKTYDFQQLPFEQRTELYEKAEVSIAWPACKNFLVGGGSGSRLQGDIGAQLFGKIADWTAATTIGVGLGTYLIDLFFFQMLTSSSSTNDPLKDFAVGTMVAGSIFLLAERVVQAILPIQYGLRYNKALRSGLGLNKDGSDKLFLGIALATLQSNQNFGFHVVGKVSLGP